MHLSYVYILSDLYNKRLYIGVTSNLLKRLSEHKNHLIEGYTKKNNISKLVYFEEFLDVKSAIRREKNLKGKLRRKKLELINCMNPEWIDFYKLLIDDQDLSEYMERRDSLLKIKANPIM